MQDNFENVYNYKNIKNNGKTAVSIVKIHYILNFCNSICKQLYVNKSQAGNAKIEKLQHLKTTTSVSQQTW